MGLPEIAKTTEDGFVDLTFRLIDLERRPDGSCVVSARGLHQRQPVAFAASLSPVWEPKPLVDANVTLYWGLVHLLRLGEEGDHFVRALDSVYGTRIKSSTMRQQALFTAVGLGTDPRKLEDEDVKLKLFFDLAGPQRYAEFYLNIKARDDVIEVLEKDDEYRRNLVLSLAAG